MCKNALLIPAKLICINEDCIQAINYKTPINGGLYLWWWLFLHKVQGIQSKISLRPKQQTVIKLYCIFFLSSTHIMWLSLYGGKMDAAPLGITSIPDRKREKEQKDT